MFGGGVGPRSGPAHNPAICSLIEFRLLLFLTYMGELNHPETHFYGRHTPHESPTPSSCPLPTTTARSLLSPRDYTALYFYKHVGDGVIRGRPDYHNRTRRHNTDFIICHASRGSRMCFIKRRRPRPVARGCTNARLP